MSDRKSFRSDIFHGRSDNVWCLTTILRPACSIVIQDCPYFRILPSTCMLPWVNVFATSFLERMRSIWSACSQLDFIRFCHCGVGCSQQHLVTYLNTVEIGKIKSGALPSCTIAMGILSTHPSWGPFELRVGGWWNPQNSRMGCGLHL